MVGAGCGACVVGAGGGGGPAGTVVIEVVGMAGGAAGGGLGELTVGLGMADAVAVMLPLALDVSPAGAVAPLVPPQAATRTSRATRPPMHTPKQRLTFCFPVVGRISGSQPESGAVDRVTIGQSTATQSIGVGDPANSVADAGILGPLLHVRAPARACALRRNASPNCATRSPQRACGASFPSAQPRDRPPAYRTTASTRRNASCVGSTTSDISPAAFLPDAQPNRPRDGSPDQQAHHLA